MTARDWKLLEQLGAHAPAAASAARCHSPPCDLADSNPAYHGFTPHQLLVEQLNTLLEAERAGALVCAKTLGQIHDESLRALLQLLREDEVQSCRGLLGSLRVLQATPSQAIGAFHEKAMALEDSTARLQLLVRGQRWVARKIGEWLPGVIQPEVRQQLEQMRADHLRGMAALERYLSAHP